MARSLRHKTNVDAPDSDYLYGRVKDNDGTNNGTPVDEELLGDSMQFFEKMMFDSGLSMNELPENAYSGFQYNQALLLLCGKTPYTHTTDGSGSLQTIATIPTEKNKNFVIEITLVANRVSGGS